MQLRSGVALERQQRVVAHHSVSIVDDADQLAAAALDLNSHPRRACVERILQQLLHHRSGPLHHFAGGDLIGHLVGKNADASHGL